MGAATPVIQQTHIFPQYGIVPELSVLFKVGFFFFQNNVIQELDQKWYLGNNLN